MFLSFSSSSWCRGLAAVCDCGTPWTFLLTFMCMIPKCLQYICIWQLMILEKCLIFSTTTREENVYSCKEIDHLMLSECGTGYRAHRLKQQQKTHFYCFGNFLCPPFRLWLCLKMTFFHILIFSGFCVFLHSKCVILELQSPDFHNFMPLWLSHRNDAVSYDKYDNLIEITPKRCMQSQNVKHDIFCCLSKC